jgi:hypothetical protein
MRNNSCSACTMIKAGVKFRKAPIHTCDKLSPKTVRFPKIAEGKHVVLRIQKTGIVETRNALKVRCQKQVIEGVTIPNGYEIWIPQGCVDMVRNPFSNIPTVGVDAWKINEVLRFLVMEELRKSDR